MSKPESAAMRAADKIVTLTQILKNPHPEWRKKQVQAVAAIIESEYAVGAGWLPIESAPKGVPLLLAWADRHLQLETLVDVPTVWIEEAPIWWTYPPTAPLENRHDPEEYEDEATFRH